LECKKIMRLDKFLKVTRLVKRRTVANQLCDGGHVSINDKVVKAASAVSIGDRLRIEFGNRTLLVTVVDLPATDKFHERDAVNWIQLVSEERRYS
jgi:ribosomal 50S subunit-recycling heat shock protein